MTVVRANAIDIEYEAIGPRDGPPMVLIMGLGMQLIAWPDDFCRGLANRGLPGHPFRQPRYRPVDQDAAIGPLTATALLAGATLRLPVRPRYDLSDMARDAIGLMDALDIDRAHVVGASMGGMIAQIVAADYPERVKSLVSLMSTSGKATLPGPSPRVLQELASPAPAARHRAQPGGDDRISAADRQPWIPDQRCRTSGQGRARTSPPSSSGWLDPPSHRRSGGAQPRAGAQAHSRSDAGHAWRGRSPHSTSRPAATPPPTFPARGSGSSPAGATTCRPHYCRRLSAKSRITARPRRPSDAPS